MYREVLETSRLERWADKVFISGLFLQVCRDCPLLRSRAFARYLEWLPLCRHFNGEIPQFSQNRRSSCALRRTPCSPVHGNSYLFIGLPSTDAAGMFLIDVFFCA